MEGTSHVEVDLKKYFSDGKLPEGKHYFEFTAGKLSKKITISNVKPPPPLFGDPIFWVAMLLSGGIVGAGMLFARKEEVYFAIDIPDFPLVYRTKIALPTSTVLEVFDKVNENYRWKYTPLTLHEIKNGFKEIYDQGKPRIISDYNVEFLLNKLEKRGLVKEALDYYGLTRWEKESGHSIVYLAMMRKLRDVCINNAVPFTQLDESPVADSEIDVMGQKMYLHFYDPSVPLEEFLKRVFGTLDKGISIILFRDEMDKSKFKSMLSSVSAAAVLLRMEGDARSVLFLTFEEFEDMLKELKM